MDSFQKDTANLHLCDIKHHATHIICDLQPQISISLAQTFNKCKLQFILYK